MMSPRVRDVLNAYQQQAKNALNLVNTTMLNNATASYQKVIAGTVSRVNAAMTNDQSAKVLELLNLKTGEVATGVTTRRDALRQALKELSDEGITGFIDKAGKRWNADTYVNMNLRTTCGNVALYVGEDDNYYHCLGGNQGDAVSIVRISKERCIAVRRFYSVGVPANVRPVKLAANGTPSTNEA